MEQFNSKEVLKKIDVNVWKQIFKIILKYKKDLFLVIIFCHDSIPLSKL